MVHFVGGLTFMMNKDGVNVDIGHGKSTGGQGSVQRVAKRFTVKGDSTTDDVRDVFILVVFADVSVLRFLSLAQDILETTGVILSATAISYTISLLLLALSLIGNVVFALNAAVMDALSGELRT